MFDIDKSDYDIIFLSTLTESSDVVSVVSKFFNRNSENAKNKTKINNGCYGIVRLDGYVYRITNYVAYHGMTKLRFEDDNKKTLA